MHATLSYAIVMALALVLPGRARGEDAPEADHEAARLKATAQAYAGLYDRLADLQLDPDRRVADFLAADEDLRAFAWRAVSEQARVGPVHTFSDGVTAAQAFVELAQVITELKAVCAEHHTGQAFRPEDFDQLRLYTEHRGLWALGQSRGEPAFGLGRRAPPGWAEIGVFGRLRARTNALENAQAQLLQAVRAVRLSPSRRLEAFFQADPRIAADLRSYIRSLPRQGDARYLPERICEVDVGLSVADLVTELKALATAHQAAVPEFSAEDFDRLLLTVRDPAMRATGVAAPEPPARRAADLGPNDVLRTTARVAAPENVEDPEQARLLAVRAAEARCRDELRETLLSMPVDDSVDASDAVDRRVASDLAAQALALPGDVDRLLSFMRLVRIKDMPDRQVEVRVELPVTRFRELIEHYREADGNREGNDAADAAAE